MRRHLIAGKFGVKDNEAIPKAADEVVTRFDLINGHLDLDHGIGDAITNLERLGLYPTEIGVDLAVLAAHVHAADTRIARGSESQDGWTREIRLVVPVSDPATWNKAAPLLASILGFLTGDIWSVGFRSRLPGFKNTIGTRPAKALTSIPYDGVSLFSGGLDSLIGGIDALQAGRSPLFVSHVGEGAVSTSQDDCFDGLEKHFKPKSKFDRLRVWMQFREGFVKDVPSDFTTRGRSFLFFALGVFAGTALNKKFELDVPENGLIAINVPLDPMRMGALSTRTTHPHYIERWNDLLKVLGIPGHIRNPYWNKTKGEMVRGCANPNLLAKLADKSMSCASPTKGRWEGLPPGHCGYCLPCLIRRAALAPSDPTTYGIPNLKKAALKTSESEGKQVRSFQFAIARLKKTPDLAKLLIYKPGPLSQQPHDVSELADVYRRGLEEVGKILVGVKTES